MAKRMTVIFEDEELYTALKVEAARKGRHAKDIVADAVRGWLEAKEDEELRAGLEERRAEWKEKGGRAWAAVERSVDGAVRKREKEAKAARV